MDPLVATLKNSTPFSGVSPEDIQKMLHCLSVREKEFPRNSFVFRAGDTVRLVYFIVSGSMHIIDEDFWGNRSIIETMRENTLFGEAYVFAARENQLVSVVAAENSVILEIDPVHLFEGCPERCACHTQVIRNTLCLLSKKIVRLTEKLEHIMQRSLGEKILSYLSKCAQRAGSSSFTIPYSRQQLADYLCVDRSSLSHELSRLQKQKLIIYRKNHFELIATHERDSI